MGVTTSEVSYTSATTGRGDHEVHEGHVVALATKKYYVNINNNVVMKITADDTNMDNWPYVLVLLTWNFLKTSTRTPFINTIILHKKLKT
jgi:hypothetical protein